jgi:hypothetical protein
MQKPTASPIGAVPCAAELQINNLNYLHHTQSGYAWVEEGRGKGHREPIYTPDFAEAIDGPEPGAPLVSDEEAMSAMAKVMNRVLHFCFENGNGEPVNLPRAFRRFCMVAWALRPELFDNMSLAALAPHLHVTRASLSQIVRRFFDENQIRNVLMKNETARESYSNAQKASHARRKKEKLATPCEAPGSDDQIATPFISTSVPSCK